jgi:hypothetical protein
MQREIAELLEWSNYRFASSTMNSIKRNAATVAIAIAKAASIHSERVGVLGTVALSVADAGPPGGTPVPVTCDVVS